MAREPRSRERGWDSYWVEVLPDGTNVFSEWPEPKRGWAHDPTLARWLHRRPALAAF